MIGKQELAEGSDKANRETVRAYGVKAREGRGGGGAGGARQHGADKQEREQITPDAEEEIGRWGWISRVEGEDVF